MEYQSARLLVDIFNSADVLLLVFIRIIGFMVIAPAFSGQTIPMMAKLSFAFCLAVIVTLTGTISAPVASDGFWGYFLLIAGEFSAGFLIGFVVYIMFAVFYYVGQLTDYQIGFSMVSVYDPLNQIQAPITGNLYYFIFLIFFLITGGMSYLLYLLSCTFSTIPLGKAFIVGNEGLILYITDMVTVYLELGFKISMPIIAAIVIVDVALGILVKAVPQMNVFVVGMPLKLLVGLFVLEMTMPLLENVMFTPFMDMTLEHVYNVIIGLTPK